MAPVQQLGEVIFGRWYVQHAAIWHWYLLLHVYNVLKFGIASVHSFFYGL